MLKEKLKGKQFCITDIHLGTRKDIYISARVNVRLRSDEFYELVDFGKEYDMLKESCRYDEHIYLGFTKINEMEKFASVFELIINKDLLKVEEVKADMRVKCDAIEQILSYIRVEEKTDSNCGCGHSWHRHEEGWGCTEIIKLNGCALGKCECANEEISE